MARTRPRVPDLPDLYQYRSLRRYLPDWQNSRSQARMASSWGWLERAAKLERNAVLEMVEDGASLSAEAVGRLAIAMGLAGDHAVFFRLLGRFCFSEDLAVRRRALLRAVRLMERHADATGQGPAFRARLHGWYFAIQVLASRPDFQADPAWIALRLVPAIPLPDLQRALDDLAALGGVRDAFIPRRMTVDGSADLADVLAVEEHLRRTSDLLIADPYAPRLATAHWAIYAEVLPAVRGMVAGQALAISGRFSAPGGGQAVERMFRVHTVAGPLPRRDDA